MGCTSSVPNMEDVQSNNPVLGDGEDSKDVDTSKKPNEDEPVPQNTPYDEQTKIVLPTCDNLDENIQLARNNYSISFSEQQVDIDQTQEQLDDPLPITEHQQQNDHPNLKDVVEQVIIDNIIQNIENVKRASDSESNSNEKEELTKESEELEKTCNNVDSIEKKEEDEHLEESVSPSQSECSRATRWEALADIAAELPASLAVDPLTGQIYSLTK